MKVKKRDGRVVEFDARKIEEAITKAFKSVDGEVSEVASERAKEIATSIATHGKDMTVEDIQDAVEKKLMASNRKDVAKAFILYRDQRTREREKRAEFMNIIREKITASNVQNQNANIDEYSFGGRKGEADSELMKKIALDEIISPLSRENHLGNMIYIHDLDSYAVGMHNCLTIPFDDLLKNGFNTRQTDVRPAQSINTAMQLVAVLFQLQSLQQFGGVSAGHLDWTMVPYVRKSFYKHWKDGFKYLEEGALVEPKRPVEEMSIEDDWYARFPKVLQYAKEMTEKETYQAVEGMFHNLNTLQSRSGNQLPFTSINYGTCTLSEGRMITRAILETSIKGVGRLHKTAIFPCQIFQVMDGINKHKGEPNYDLYRLALESTSLRLYPNYANCDWSGNAGYDKNDPKTYFNTMGCRTANGFDINGLGQLKDGRGNICPVTIILPTLAMMAKESCRDGEVVEEFLRILDTKIAEAKDMLLERFEWICSQSSESAKFMYENGLMAGYVPEEGIRSALKHGTIVIGQLGLAETLQILVGCDHTTAKGMELAKRIEQLFKDRCSQYKQEYKLNFGVYYTPAENLCYTAMKKFRAKYGVIPKVSDREYFTNSMHVPVWERVNPFEKIDIEAQLTGYSNAGCITYTEFESSVKNNLDALEQIVTYAMDKDIPYFAVNVPNDTCLDCGYTDEIGEECPICGSKKIQRLRRVTGYLTGNYTTAFNLGKQAEVAQRTKHDSGWEE